MTPDRNDDAEIDAYIGALKAQSAGSAPFAAFGWYVPSLDRLEVFLHDEEAGIFEDGLYHIRVRVAASNPRRILGFAIESFRNAYGAILAQNVRVLRIRTRSGTLALEFIPQKGPTHTITLERLADAVISKLYAGVKDEGDVEVPVHAYEPATVGA